MSAVPQANPKKMDRWDIGDTAISPKAQFFMGVKTTGKTHVTERISLADHDHMTVDTVVDDAIALARPWHYTWTYVRSRVPFVESYYCDDDRDSNGEPNLEPPPRHGEAR